MRERDDRSFISLKQDSTALQRRPTVKNYRFFVTNRCNSQLPIYLSLQTDTKLFFPVGGARDANVNTLVSWRQCLSRVEICSDIFDRSAVKPLWLFLCATSNEIDLSNIKFQFSE